MADLRAALTGHEIIGLDTNPFIYLFERHPTYYPLVETLFDYPQCAQCSGNYLNHYLD